MLSSRSTTTVLLAVVLKIVLFAVAGTAQGAPSLPGVSSLTLRDSENRSVRGITCDNLADMPDAQQDRLYLPLPDALSRASLSLSLSNADLAEKASVGTVVRDGDHLIYTPPEEFNANPCPHRLAEIYRSFQRTVLLSVRRYNLDHTTTLIAQQPIVLARPPVVLVHGINTSATSPSWISQGRLAAVLPRYGLTLVLADHGKHDFSSRDPRTRPALGFHGNGPVEYAAQQLANTITQTLQRVREQEHLAIRRVDLIGYSYGGLIGRWYLHGFRKDPHVRDSVRWYTRSLNNGNPRGLYWLDPDWYRRQMNRQETISQESDGSGRTAPPVRKYITIASMWRGLPLCNYVNELHSAPRPPSEGPNLADAPLLGSTLGAVIDGPLAEVLPTRVPAMEVMAVNSPWLMALDDFRGEGQRKPFLEEVAYGAVAGDDSAFLALPGIAEGLFDPYSVLRLAQIPSWFPYLALERHQGAENGYTDGLVPLWSALIANDFNGWHPSRIVHANHDSILSDRQMQAYILCALNNRDWLPTGRMLNDRWGETLFSRDLVPLQDTDPLQNLPIPGFISDSPSRIFAPERLRKSWEFQQGEMAPTLENALYPQIDGVGRIDPVALREIHSVRIEAIRQTSVEVSWRTAAPVDGEVTVTQWQNVNFGAYDEVDVACRIEPIGHRVTKEHRFRLSGLLPNTSYRLIAASETTDGTGDVVAVRSEPIRFSTKP